MKTKHIAIFASGSGSNARKILEHFEDNDSVEVALIITNRKNAGVLAHAREFDVPSLRIDKDYFKNNDSILKVLNSEKVDLIVLAGFLWLIPPYLIANFPDRIINIHPSLLPKYGGKGMYGHHVHEAVKANNETESGMTIHLVNEKFDDGAHLFQASCLIDSCQTAEEIAKSVLALEHKNYPLVIEEYLNKI